jgi:hypothetical protein
LARKEHGWENRITLTSNLEELNKKSKAKAALEESMLSTRKEQLGSSSSRPKTAPSNSRQRGGGDMGHASSSSRSAHKKSSRSHRVDFEGVSDNDLIANGLYYLDDEQMEVYDRFTSLLACHDPFDMVGCFSISLSPSPKFTYLCRHTIGQDSGGCPA